LLIFIGFNVLAVQIRRPWGTLLSLFLALSAVGVFGYLLLEPNSNMVTDRLGIAAPSDQLNEETITVSSEDVEAAEVWLELGNYRTVIQPLVYSSLIISGTVQTRGDVEVQTEQKSDGLMAVHIRENDGGIRFLDPKFWNEEGIRWEFFLKPTIPTELRLDGGNGATDANLETLTLSYLRINGGNGALDATLPGGNYDISVDGGNGSMGVALPASGRQKLEIDGGNGSMTLGLSPGMEARVEFDKGTGGLNVSERFTLSEGDTDEGVYQTNGYETAANRILIKVETGNGLVTIQEP